MTATVGFWHLVGFLVPSVGLGLISTLLVRWGWQRAARQVGGVRLAAVSVSACLLAALVALVVTGRDGTMIGYGAMVGACALSQWWMLRRR
jgi:hypothetical protein